MRKKDLKLYLILFVGMIVFSLLYQLVIWIANFTIYQWVFILTLLVGIIFIVKHFKHKKRLNEAEERRKFLERQSNLEGLMKMTWLDFEKYIRDLFILLGFEASLTSATGDGGKDILLYYDDFFAVIECKRYGHSSKVTRPDIQKFHSAIIDCKADKGFFITTGEFTRHAESYVLDKPIQLINGKQLVEIIQEATQCEGKDNFMKYLISKEMI